MLCKAMDRFHDQPLAGFRRVDPVSDFKTPHTPIDPVEAPSPGNGHRISNRSVVNSWENTKGSDSWHDSFFRAAVLGRRRPLDSPDRCGAVYSVPHHLWRSRHRSGDRQLLGSQDMRDIVGERFKTDPVI